MKLSLIFLLLASCLVGLSWGSTLTPFSTDYCTAYPEGTLARPEVWKHCCLTHDLYFWAGGDLKDRMDADLELKICVEETGEVFQANVIYWAVTLGAHSPIKFGTKKWGHGWNAREAYQKLSLEETEIIESEINSSYSYISSELKDHFTNQLYLRLD